MDNQKDIVPIDTTKINVNITELEPPDFQLDFEIPQELVVEMHDRLIAGGLEYDDKQMVGLLTKVCLDEGMFRLNKLSIWGPKLLPGTKPGVFSLDSPFSFSAIVDAFAVEDIPEVEEIPISRNTMQVDDEMINSELVEQQLQFGTREPHSGQLEYGDVITASVTYTIEGESEPQFSIDECQIRIPKEGQTTVVEQYHFEDAGEQLLGVQPDGKLKITLNSDSEESKAVLELDIKSVERITPVSIEEVLKKYGTPNETILRTQIKLSLQHNFDRENEMLMLTQLYKHLDKTFGISIPERIIESRFDELCKNEQSIVGEDVKLSKELKETLYETARFLTKRKAINMLLQEFFKLRVSEQDINTQIRNVAESRRVRPEDIREEFVSDDKISILGNRVIEQKIFEKLRDKMVFTTVG